MIDLEILKVQSLPEELYELYEDLQCWECGHLCNKSRMQGEIQLDCNYCGTTYTEKRTY